MEQKTLTTLVVGAVGFSLAAGGTVVFVSLALAGASRLALLAAFISVIIGWLIVFLWAALSSKGGRRRASPDGGSEGGEDSPAFFGDWDGDGDFDFFF